MSKFGTWNPYVQYEQSYGGKGGSDGGKGSGKGGKGVGKGKGGGNWSGGDGKGKGGCNCAISFGIFEQSCMYCSGGSVRLKNVSQATLDYVFPQSCVSHGDATHIHSDSDLLHYVQQKAAERCNLALSNVQNSWSNSNNAYNLDLYNSTIGGSKIYCLDAVTVAAKNSGLHSATNQLRRWFNDTHDEYGCIKPGSKHTFAEISSAPDSPWMYESFYDFIAQCR